MPSRDPFLTVRGPGGQEQRITLCTDRVTVGRAAPGVRPDVVLDPDPQNWVGRIHCVFELVEGAWTIADNATVNGTYLRRGDTVDKVSGQVRLRHGDVVMVLGDLVEEGPRYWQLRLADPFTTQPAPFGGAPPAASTPAVEYDWVEARLFRAGPDGRTEVTGLPPKAHQLVRVMVRENQRNGGAAVVCTHEQLRTALWGERDEWPAHRAYTDQDVRDVVYQARQRIEASMKAPPRYLVTVRGLGYRLHSQAVGRLG